MLPIGPGSCAKLSLIAAQRQCRVSRDGSVRAGSGGVDPLLLRTITGRAKPAQNLSEPFSWVACLEKGQTLSVDRAMNSNKGTKQGVACRLSL